MKRPVFVRPEFKKADIRAPRHESAGALLRQLDRYCAEMGIFEPGIALTVPRRNVRIIG